MDRVITLHKRPRPIPIGAQVELQRYSAVAMYMMCKYIASDIKCHYNYIIVYIIQYEIH